MSSDNELRSPPPQGLCDERMRAVREAFAHNLEQEDELGAAVCVYVDGRKCVDLWGGFASLETRALWQRDTLVNAYSIGKGVLSILLLTLAERGRLDFDQCVAELWPEFAQADKGDIRLPTLLSHAAGLPAVRRRLPEGAMFDWNGMCAALAEQAPWWAPGTAHGYHTASFGYLAGEIVQRAAGLSLGDALREYLTGPLQADFAWGIDAARRARTAYVHSPAAELVITDDMWARAFPPTGDADYDLMRWHGYFNPNGLSGGGIVNSEAWQRARVPSANGHGTARAVAVMYDALLGGWRGGRPLVSKELVERARTPLSDGEDLMLQRPSRFGLGFQVSHANRPIGHGEGVFGHYGYGGSLGFADPANQIAFGYVRNKPGDRWRTPRTLALVDAVYESLGIAI